jgi:hypothetical protein
VHKVIIPSSGFNVSNPSCAFKALVPTNDVAEALDRNRACEQHVGDSVGSAFDSFVRRDNVADAWDRNRALEQKVVHSGNGGVRTFPTLLLFFLRLPP